jgi:hypothetical protein
LRTKPGRILRDQWIEHARAIVDAGQEASGEGRLVPQGPESDTALQDAAADRVPVEAVPPGE